MGAISASKRHRLSRDPAAAGSHEILRILHMEEAGYTYVTEPTKEMETN